MRVGADRLPWCRHICLPIVTGGGEGIETCEVVNVFPPNDLWFGLDTYTNCAVSYSLYLDV